MNHTLQLDIAPLPVQINYKSRIFLTGSCFTENMSDRLLQHKFNMLANPHGILFNPMSVADSLNGYIEGKKYTEDELFYLNELWNSWDHHTRFSDIDKNVTLDSINRSQEQATTFIKTASHVIITLGTSFQYYLIEDGKPVSNNHRAPSQWFEKVLLGVDDIVNELSETLDALFKINPGVQVIFTVSPVRHIRDSVVANNRSKSRLIEAVHTLCDNYEKAYYFPAYELVIDILRDYRYFDIDFVHPNYLATTYVWEQFANSCMDEETRTVMKLVNEIIMARRHRPRFPQTEAHRKFMESNLNKIRALQEQYPYLQLNEELEYFTGA